MKEGKFTTISIPLPLANRVREFIKDTGFTSMSDFVTFLLRDFLAEERSQEHDYVKAREEIRNKLKALGYID